MSKVLFIGDIVGKGGREVLRQVLPQWQEKYKPDVTIVNVENMAHGKGVTPNTMESIAELDIDCYTSGNHVFDKRDLSKECFEKYDNLIRPANYPSNLPGYGYYRFSKKTAPSSALRAPSPQGEKEKMNESTQQYLILNLNGQVFMEKQFDGGIDNAFLALDKLLTEQKQKGDIIIVDLHAEATSEKIAFGYYADGRVSGVFGTHTHVATADARILEGGTGYVTDAGMTGPRESVIGVKKENVLKKFLDPSTKFKNEVVEDGIMMINGVLLEVGENGKGTRIEKLYQEL